MKYICVYHGGLIELTCTVAVDVSHPSSGIVMHANHGDIPTNIPEPPDRPSVPM